MRIILEANNNRVLIKDTGEKVNINNGDIIEYTGIYYKTINDIVAMVEIRAAFIGAIDFAKITSNDCIEGIYIKPLYIRDNIRKEWNKIVNFKPREDISMLYYPHLLLLPDLYHAHFPLYFLHTCKNKRLEDYTHICKCFSLDM